MAAHPEARELLQNLNEQLRRYALHFGYRVFDEIVTFSAAAGQSGVFSEVPSPNAALDTAVLLKVLPKFHGARSKLEAPLKAALAWCQNPESPNPASLEMLTQKAETAEAIRHALT